MSDQAGPRDIGRDALERLAALAREAGAEDVAFEVGDLALRAADGLFYVACLGQFKRGKSTLLNALLGTDVLPVGVTPATSVPTVLRFGEPAARVRLRHGWEPAPLDRLADYVSETGNPANRKGLSGVEVCLPSALLRTGLCLVDLPGLGSTSPAAGTATREFLPHIDAAIAVLGADPPITGEELACIADAHARVGNVLFVLSKADRVPPADRTEARAFAERVLAEALGCPVGRILETSGLAAARDEAMTRDWARLVTELTALAERAGASLVEAGVRRGVARISGRLRWTLRERRRALLEPVEATTRRLEQLRALGAEVERAMRDLAPLLDGETRRLSQEVAAARERFLGTETAAALAELRGRLGSPDSGGAGPSRREALAVANAVARARVDPWLARAEREGAAAYQRATARFAELARDLFRRLEGAGLETDSLAGDLPVTPGLDRRRFFFHDRLRFHGAVAPWGAAVDVLVSAAARRHRRVSAAERYLADLLEVNAFRAEGDLVERVTASRRRFEADLGRLLSAVRSAGEEALAGAAAVRSRGEIAVRAEVDRLDALLGRLDAL